MRTLPPTPDNLARLKAGALALRQRQGPRSSLGLVKLMIPNPFDIYLHDNPAHSGFRHDWTPEKIRAAMGGRAPTQVNPTARRSPTLTAPSASSRTSTASMRSFRKPWLPGTRIRSDPAQRSPCLRAYFGPE